MDSANVTVTVVPDLRPGDAGNTLRAVRSGGEVVLSWGTVTPPAATWVLYRGLSKGGWPPPPFYRKQNLPWEAAGLCHDLRSA